MTSLVITPRQGGFTLVSAIFILVVLAALGAAIVTVFTGQQMGSALDIQGAQAYQAARAGIEWGVYQVNSTAAYNFAQACPATDTGAMCANRRTCANASGSFNPPAPSLSAYTVVVSCTANVDGSGGPTVYVIESTASAGTVATVGFIERRLQVSF